MADAERYFEAYKHAAIAAIGKAAGGKSGDRSRRRGFRSSSRRCIRATNSPSAARPWRVGAAAEGARARRQARPTSASPSTPRRPTASISPSTSSRRWPAIPRCAGWDGLRPGGAGLSETRALALIDWLAELAGRHRPRLMVRLVKGAYWDTEIKLAQEAGPGRLSGVHPQGFDRRLPISPAPSACSPAPNAFYPQFATHNAHSLAAVLELAGARRATSSSSACTAWARRSTTRWWGRSISTCRCRIYAPVGSHEDLLAYLVRRLLENGANTSFVNRIVDETRAGRRDHRRSRSKASAARCRSRIRKIPLPAQISTARSGATRRPRLDDPNGLAPLGQAMAAAAASPWTAAPLVGGRRARARPGRSSIRPTGAGGRRGGRGRRRRGGAGARPGPKSAAPELGRARRPPSARDLPRAHGRPDGGR